MTTVLLLDEPFSAFDQPTRNALRLLVRELVDTQHLTALLVTHDLDDIVHLADRVVLYEPGHTTAGLRSRVAQRVLDVAVEL